MSEQQVVQVVGADAAAAPTPSPLRPLLYRVAIGCVALIGLSGIGAVSMLAGLDGAHASPPAAGSIWVAGASASASSEAMTQAPASGAAMPSGPGATTPAASGAASAAANAPTAASTPGASASNSESASCLARTADGRVILNLANVEELRKIPGIGPKRAEAIVALRNKLKRFKRSSDLLRVRGIGPKSLARMQSHFVVDPPAGSECPTSTAAAK